MSTYRTLKGYNIKSVTSDPSNTKEGQIWYNDTSNKIRVNTVKPAAWASGGNLGTARFSMNQGAGTQTAGLVAGGNPSNSTLAVAEEYGDLFGGADNWLKHYRLATPEKYNFCYMDLQSNPPLMYSNFDKVVLVGGHQDEVEVDMETEENIEKENIKK